MTAASKLLRTVSLATGLVAAPLAYASEVPAPVQVPEPETLALFAAGLGIVALARRLRR